MGRDSKTEMTHEMLLYRGENNKLFLCIQMKAESIVQFEMVFERNVVAWLVNKITALLKVL